MMHLILMYFVSIILSVSVMTIESWLMIYHVVRSQNIPVKYALLLTPFNHIVIVRGIAFVPFVNLFASVYFIVKFDELRFGFLEECLSDEVFMDLLDKVKVEIYENQFKR